MSCITMWLFKNVTLLQSWSSKQDLNWGWFPPEVPAEVHGYWQTDRISNFPTPDVRSSAQRKDPTWGGLCCGGGFEQDIQVWSGNGRATYWLSFMSRKNKVIDVCFKGCRRQRERFQWSFWQIFPRPDCRWCCHWEPNLLASGKPLLIILII